MIAIALAAFAERPERLGYYQFPCPPPHPLTRTIRPQISQNVKQCLDE